MAMGHTTGHKSVDFASGVFGSELYSDIQQFYVRSQRYNRKSLG